RPPPPAAAAAGARCSPAAPAPVAAPPPRTSSSCSPLGSTLTAYRQSIPRNPGNGSRIPGFLRFFNPVSPPGRGSARPRPGPPSTLSWAGRSPVAVAGLPGAGVAVADAGAGDLGEASALRDGGAPVAGPVVARRAAAAGAVPAPGAAGAGRGGGGGGGGGGARGRGAARPGGGGARGGGGPAPPPPALPLPPPPPGPRPPQPFASHQVRQPLGKS